MILLPKDNELITKLNNEGFKANEYNNSNNKLKIGILNLMPIKIETEYHFSKILSTYKQDIELYFLKIENYKYKNTPIDYINKFYFNFNEKILQLDMVIFTGAPVEEMPFSEVRYWNELTTYLDIIKAKKIPSIFVCWSAQAALYYYYNIEKINIPKKSFGIYENEIINNDIILEDLTKPIEFPVSRHSDVIKNQIENNINLKIILSSNKVGVFLVKDKILPNVYITGHPEYSSYILKNEYERDINNKRNDVSLPYNYSLNNPTCFWEKNAIKIYHNILNNLLKK